MLFLLLAIFSSTMVSVMMRLSSHKVSGSYSVLVQRGTFTMNGGSIESAGENGSLSVQGTTETNGGKAYVNAGTVGKIFANRSSIVEIAVGVTYGDITTAHTPTITVAGEASVKVGDKYTAYATLTNASYAMMACQTLVLNKDLTVGAFSVPATITLDLNGKTLTAESFTSACEGAQVIDSVGTGKIVTASASFAPDNAQLPVENNGEYTFETVQFASKYEENGTKATYKFYIAGDAAETLIDDAILAGADIALEVKVTWTSSNGTDCERTFVLNETDLALYAGNWDTKMIILTIKDISAVSNVNCVAQIVADKVVVTA